MRGGAGDHGGPDAGRVSRDLIDAPCNRGGGQQGRFETDSGGTGGRGLTLVPVGVNHLECAGKGSLHREGEVYIGEIGCAGSNWSDVHAVGKALRIRAELQDESGIVRRHICLHVAGAIIGGGIDGDIALRRWISSNGEEPGREECIRGGRGSGAG